MYSRQRRGSNFLQQSEQSLLRQRRDTEWHRQLEARARLQAEFAPAPQPQTEPQLQPQPQQQPATHSSADSALGAVRRLSNSLRRRATQAPPPATSGLLPSTSLGPLASAVRFSAISKADVIRFLDANPDVLNHYVEDYVDAPTLKDWLSAKTSGAVRSHDTLHSGPYIEPHASDLRARLLDDAADAEHVPRMVHELARVAAAAVHADAFTVFLIDAERNELNEYTPGKDDFVKRSQSCLKIVEESAPAPHAAATGEALLIDSIAADRRFPLGFGLGVSEKDRSALIVPLPGLAVLELRRGLQHEPFESYHLETVNSIFAWFTIAISKLKSGEAAQQQEDLNAFLLEVAQSLFEEVFSQDALISKIMVYAKSLVDADRVTFFAMEEGKNELVASLFDEGKVANGTPVLTKRQEIRFSVEMGIAGYCAKYSQLVNVQDAYADPRFNQEVDHKTGYKSRSLLAYPVVARGHVLGVLQMVNKIDGDFFTQADEAALRMFGIYCSLALFQGMAHDHSQKKEHQLDVCQDMLQYHSSASPEELQMYFKQPLPASIPADFATFGWAPTQEHSLNRLYLHMFLDLVGASRVLPENLVTFVTTIIKSYRRVPYHNSTHAFMVAHTMYNILKLNPTIFSRLEMMALLLACVCHDADHRGYSNTYAKASTSLGALYKSSVMESHHYSTSVAVMRRPKHDVLSELSSKERKEVLDLMYEAIIATDLAVYFQIRPKLEGHVSSGQFNITNQQHRGLFRSIMMTSCDLSAICKHPEVVLQHTLKLYVEFHEQGDKEKEKGLTPDPMMDRSKAMNLPSDQVNFVKYLCMPAYEIIGKVFPNTEEMLNNVKRTLAYWKDIKDKGSSSWKPYPSWPEPVHTEVRLSLAPPPQQRSASH